MESLEKIFHHVPARLFSTVVSTLISGTRCVPVTLTEVIWRKVALDRSDNDVITDPTATIKSTETRIILIRLFFIYRFDCIPLRLRENISLHYSIFVEIVSLPKYFCKTGGIAMEPSAFWKFSTRETRIRGVGMAVAFREYAYFIFPSLSL